MVPPPFGTLKMELKMADKQKKKVKEIVEAEPLPVAREPDPLDISGVTSAGDPKRLATDDDGNLIAANPNGEV